MSVAILDHPGNPNYPTFWHARGYGLFAANPLGEKIFTNGASAKNLHLKKGEAVTYRHRIRIDEGAGTPTARPACSSRPRARLDGAGSAPSWPSTPSSAPA